MEITAENLRLLLQLILFGHLFEGNSFFTKQVSLLFCILILGSKALAK